MADKPHLTRSLDQTQPVKFIICGHSQVLHRELEVGCHLVLLLPCIESVIRHCHSSQTALREMLQKKYITLAVTE